MNKSYLSLLSFIIILATISGCEDTPRERNCSIETPCERFNCYYLGCWCDGTEGYHIIYESNETVEGKENIEDFIRDHYVGNLTIDDANVTCYPMSQHDFFSCFIDDEYYATYSEGDIFKTICGV